MTEQRLFDVEQANAALAEVVPLLERLRAAHATMDQRQDEVTTSAPTNGGGAAHAAFLQAGGEVSRVLDALERLGVVVRDPATGLIDFPSERDDEPVFLCFRLGETEVAWWHPTDTGFSGRRPL